MLCGWLAAAGTAAAGPFGTDLQAENCSASTAGDGNFTYIDCSGFSTQEVAALRESDRQKAELEKAESERLLKEQAQGEISALAKENAVLKVDQAVAAAGLQSEPVYTQAALVEATRSFDAKDYTMAAVFAHEAYNTAGTAHRARLGDLTTASLFGAGRHREGLAFLCDRYQDLPASDHRYRHDIFSHVRAIARQEGYPAALTALATIRGRKGCNRDDFSPIWASIPMEIGWAIAKGWSRKDIYSRTPPISDDDLKLMEMLVAARVPFSDYGLFVLRRFDQLATDYPHSFLRELSDLGEVEYADSPAAIVAAADAFLASYPASDYRDRVLNMKADAYLAAGDLRNAASTKMAVDPERYQASLAKHEIERFAPTVVDLWAPFAKSGRQAITDALGLGDVQGAARLVDQLATDEEDFFAATGAIDFAALATCEAALFPYEERAARLPEETDSEPMEAATDETGDDMPPESGVERLYAGMVGTKCDNDVVAPRAKLEYPSIRDYIDFSVLVSPTTLAAAANFLRDSDQTLAPLHDAGLLEGILGVRDCIEGRMPDVRTPACRALVFGLGRAPARAYLYSLYDRCADICDEENAARALYLHAMQLKRSWRYADAAEKFQSIVDRYPDSHLVDDALTEIGWHYFAVKQDFRAAERSFTDVIETYPDRNAYDNALNWMAIMDRQTGRFGRSLAVSLDLVAHAVSERLKAFAGDRSNELRMLSARTLSRDFSESVVFCDTWDYAIFGSSTEESTVRVCDVVRDSVAWQRGVRKGMQIDNINGEYVNTVYEMASLVQSLDPQQPVELVGYDLETFAENRVSVVLGDIVSLR